MKLEEGIKKMTEYCANEAKTGNWFSDKEVSFSRTRLLNAYEKIINALLPERICYPEIPNDKEAIIINASGISFGNSVYKWSDIVATGIKTVDKKNDSPVFRSLLLITYSGRIIDWPIRDFDQYYGQMGDFIEQYKLKFKEQKQKKDPE